MFNNGEHTCIEDGRECGLPAVGDKEQERVTPLLWLLMQYRGLPDCTALPMVCLLNGSICASMFIERQPALDWFAQERPFDDLVFPSEHRLVNVFSLCKDPPTGGGVCFREPDLVDYATLVEGMP